MEKREPIKLRDGDVLLIVDVQNDFLPGGALGVSGGDEVVAVLNAAIERFRSRKLAVIATRDWHPVNHCSFHAQGGPWPPHCIANTPGAAFAERLQLPVDATVISKGTMPNRDAYSGFDGTELDAILRAHGTKCLFIGGLATDYCVLNTVTDALERRFQTYVLADAIRAVNVYPTDGAKAEAQMTSKGAQMITPGQIV